jgi:NAD(P)-dependent dehydrogenase (short-subunit alcohol dehydrogenase family)
MTQQKSRSLDGQVAVITGSTRGIGGGIAEKFAEHGARVVVHGLEKDEGEKRVAEIQASGGEALLVVGHVSAGSTSW